MKKIFLYCMAVVMAACTFTACDDEGGGGGDAPDVVNKKVVVISDLHMNDKRANDGGWGWLKERRSALISFLKDIAKKNNEYSTLVVAGDMFDEWVSPMDQDPYQNTRKEGDFFKILVNDNKDVLDAFREVKSAGVNLVYVPGNHDLTCTAEDFDANLPGLFTQARDAFGLGAYTPVDMPEVVIEHGHRYDYSNMPNPISTPGGYLPAGYVVSKYASTVALNKQGGGSSSGSTGELFGDLETLLQNPLAGMMYNLFLSSKGITNWLTFEEFSKAVMQIKADLEFVQQLQNNGMVLPEITEDLNHRAANVAWALVIAQNPPSGFDELLNLLFSEIKFPEPYHASYRFCDIIPYFNEAKTIPEEPVLFQNLWTDKNWSALLTTNKVSVPLPFVTSILAGGINAYLDALAPTMYFDNPTSDKRIVVFGHTHKGKIISYTAGSKGKCIYANTGCWVDNQWGNVSDGTTFQTYVELQKTDAGYTVSLKEWGKSSALAIETIEK